MKAVVCLQPSGCHVFLWELSQPRQGRVLHGARTSQSPEGDSRVLRPRDAQLLHATSAFVLSALLLRRHGRAYRHTPRSCPPCLREQAYVVALAWTVLDRLGSTQLHSVSERVGVRFQPSSTDLVSGDSHNRECRPDRCLGS